jgi:hypothetical protein
VFGNTATGQSGTLSNTLVKESTTWIQNSTIQAVQVNFLDQLSLVPILFGNFLPESIHSFFLACISLRSAYQRANKPGIMLPFVGKDSAIGTHDPRLIAESNIMFQISAAECVLLVPSCQSM